MALKPPFVRDSDVGHREIARGLVSVAAFVLLGKIAAAAKEVAIAYRYGVAHELDAFFFVFTLVNWPVTAALGVLSVVLVPLIARLRSESPVELKNFRAELLGLTILVGLALAIAASVAMPGLLLHQPSGLTRDTADVAANMARSMATVIPLGMVASLLSVWMLSQGRHVGTLLEGIPALVVLAAVMAFGVFGYHALVWGTVGGFIAHVVALAFALARRHDIERPAFFRRSFHWQVFWQGFGVTLVGQVLITFLAVIDQLFASHAGAGGIATLTYANRIVALVLSLTAIAVSRATLPVFAELHTKNDQRLYHVALRWTRGMFATGVLVVAVLWIFAPWLVSILFERGAFTSADGVKVTSVFRFALPQIPFFLAGLVLVSYASSRRLYLAITLSSAIAVVVKILGNLVLMPVMGIEGIALSWSAVYAATALFFTCVLWRRPV